jgi:uncharacterized protein (TIGR03437 family)
VKHAPKDAEDEPQSSDGVSVPVTYIGPQGTYAGLDQINLALPQSLAGTGVASVSVSAGGNVSNTVFVTIK